MPISPPKWDAAFQPHLWMSLQFKMRFVLIDTTANRILDFVNLSSVQPVVDIPAMLDNTANGFENESDLNAPWDTNFLNGMLRVFRMGIQNQIDIGQLDIDGRSTDFKIHRRTVQASEYSTTVFWAIMSILISFKIPMHRTGPFTRSSPGRSTILSSIIQCPM